MKATRTVDGPERTTPDEAVDFVRVAAVLTAVQGIEFMKGLLAVPDEELGRRLKEGIRRIMEDAPFLLTIPPRR